MSESENNEKEQIKAILKALTEEERELLWKIIKAERDKLHMSRARGINTEIISATKEIIK